MVMLEISLRCLFNGVHRIKFLCTVLGNLLYTVADVCFDINYSLLDHSNVPLCMSLQMRTLKQDICFRVNTNVLFVVRSATLIPAGATGRNAPRFCF